MRRVVGAKTKQPAEKRAVEMAGLWKEWKAKSRLPTLSTSPLEISPRAGEIPTFPQLRRLLPISERTAHKKGIGSVGRGKVEIQNQGFPLFHRPDSLRQQGKQPFTKEKTGRALRAALRVKG
jgi:hypothetical protein